MQKFTFIAAFVFAASPAVAQVTSQNSQAPSSNQGAPTAPTQAPIGGVFCTEEMTANFCNMVTGPNTSGYGARSGSASTTGSASTSSASTTSAGGAGGGTSSIPPCPADPPFNELCN